MQQSLSFLVKFCLSGMLPALAAGPLCWAQDDAQETEVYLLHQRRRRAGGLARPHGLAATPGNRGIRRVDPSGTITTIAGTGTRGYSGNDRHSYNFPGPVDRSTSPIPTTADRLAPPSPAPGRRVLVS